MSQNILPLLDTIAPSRAMVLARDINIIPADISSLSNIFNNKTVGHEAELHDLHSLKGVFNAPQNSSFSSGTTAPASRNFDSSYPIIIDGVLRSLRVLDRDLKKAFKKAQKTEYDDEPAQINKSKVETFWRPISKIESSIARSVARGQPLTKKMTARLEILEAAGYIKIDDLKTKEEQIGAIQLHKDKISLSKFDIQLLENCKKGDYSKVNISRLQKLINEGYVNKKKDRQLEVSDKLIATAHNMILKEYLELRVSNTIATTPITKSARENTKHSTLGREIKRSLNDDQITAVMALYNFCNMTKGQLYSIYKDNGQEIYFEKDIKSLLKKGVIESEDKRIDGANVKLYNLKYTGNMLAQSLNGTKLSQSEADPDIANLKQTEGKEKLLKSSKKYTKNNAELLHDLLQFEAVKYFSKDIESNGGAITNITIDRHKRSQIYDGISIRENGGISGRIVDVELDYENSDSDQNKMLIEVDRNYKAEVIRTKSNNNPPMVWVTDSKRQYNRISRNIKKTDKVFLIS